MTLDPGYERALRTEMRALLDDPGNPVLPLLDVAAVRATLEDPEGLNRWARRANVELPLQLNTWLIRYGVRLVL
ncbi:asparagine synthase (glutamine-hydrolyzing) OS=Streptomyces tendae OX=1932 GN=llpA PE=3 SV=1 [Streptomyces tendae]